MCTFSGFLFGFCSGLAFAIMLSVYTLLRITTFPEGRN